jgi:hypothetical protein
MLAAALLLLAAYATITAWFGVLAVIVFMVVNLRCLFPWPLHESEVVRGYALARALSLSGLIGGAILTVLAFVVPWYEWRWTFFLLSLVGGLNLLALKQLVGTNRALSV